MQIKHLIVVFFVVLIVADYCHAIFFSLIPGLVSGLVSAIKGRRKRDLTAQLQQYRNLQKRDAEFKEFLDNLPIY
uniref:Antimicrobial peptide n=1 Tax=Centruroides hentzi TaxID=88313 RepID=A0A2I9LNR2_9SCOR